jgi:hypothetical protein
VAHGGCGCDWTPWGDSRAEVTSEVSDRINILARTAARTHGNQWVVIPPTLLRPRRRCDCTRLPIPVPSGRPAVTLLAARRRGHQGLQPRHGRATERDLACPGATAPRQPAGDVRAARDVRSRDVTLQAGTGSRVAQPRPARAPATPPVRRRPAATPGHLDASGRLAAGVTGLAWAEVRADGASGSPPQHVPVTSLRAPGTESRGAGRRRAARSRAHPRRHQRRRRRACATGVLASCAGAGAPAPAA